MKTFPSMVVILAGLGFLAFGIWLLLDPVGGLAKVDIVGSSRAGEVELRAFYGGLEIGLGLWLLAAVQRATWRRPALWLVLFVNGGTGLARLMGIALTGVFTPFFAACLLWELGFAVLAALALRK